MKIGSSSPDFHGYLHLCDCHIVYQQVTNKTFPVFLDILPPHNSKSQAWTVAAGAAFNLCHAVLSVEALAESEASAKADLPSRMPAAVDFEGLAGDIRGQRGA